MVVVVVVVVVAQGFSPCLHFTSSPRVLVPGASRAHRKPPVRPSWRCNLLLPVSRKSSPLENCPPSATSAPFDSSFFLSFSASSSSSFCESLFLALPLLLFILFQNKHTTQTRPHTHNRALHLRFSAHLLALLFVPLFVAAAAHLLRYATRVILFALSFFCTQNKTENCRTN